MVDNAAFAFTEYCLREVEQKTANCDDQIELYNAFQYLAHYHLKKGCLDDAYANAYKCLEHEEVSLHFSVVIMTSFSICLFGCGSSRLSFDSFQFIHSLIRIIRLLGA